MPTAIELETERLRLRCWQERHIAPFAALNADPEVMRYFPATVSEEQTRAGVEMWRAQFAERGWSNWAAELKETGEFIGFVGLSVPRRQFPFSPCVEIGWRLARAHWGRGYASEGARAALALGFERLGLERIVSFTSLTNLRSRAVMERVGMFNTGQDFDHPAVPEGSPLRRHCLYALSAEQWRARPAAPLPAWRLRPAAPDDALCLSVLAMQVFLDTYATRGIRPAVAREAVATYSQTAFARDIASPASRIVVAEAEGHLVGFAQITLNAGHELAPAAVPAELLRLYVQEPFTGKHLGTELLAAAQRLAAGQGATVLWLTPWAHNHRALAFYARRGYTDHGLTWFTFEGEAHPNRVLAKAIGAPTATPIAATTAAPIAAPAAEP